MSETHSVYILGAGRCGRALGSALAAAGYRLAGLWNHTERGAQVTQARFPGVPVDWGRWPAHFRGASAVWVTVPDRALADAAAQLRGVPIALHASGATPADVLRHPNGAAHVAAAHPVQSFPPQAVGPEHLAGVYFGLEGDESALEVARVLIADMGATRFEVGSAEQKALYHAACCVASNTLVPLMERAVRLFAAAGVDRSNALAALLPLVQGTVDNLGRTAHPMDALTGPVARGDRAVVSAHRAAIDSVLPEERSAYEMTLKLIETTRDSSVSTRSTD